MKAKDLKNGSLWAFSDDQKGQILLLFIYLPTKSVLFLYVCEKIKFWILTKSLLQNVPYDPEPFK